VLFGGALAALVPYVAGRVREGGAAAVLLPLALVPSGDGRLAELFLTMLKIGAVLYGSGYVLIAFLRNDFVNRLGWLTDRQLLDAIAIGQVTPGPVFTTATFVGYLVAGGPGAILATIAIFLPSFVFVALSHPLLPRIRGSRGAAAFLDGVNVAALGLMAAVAWQLARTAIVDLLTAGLMLITLALLIRTRVNSAWLVLGGAAAGLAYRALVG
jgi:chromate transporter